MSEFNAFSVRSALVSKEPPPGFEGADQPWYAPYFKPQAPLDQSPYIPPKAADEQEAQGALKELLGELKQQRPSGASFINSSGVRLAAAMPDRSSSSSIAPLAMDSSFGPLRFDPALPRSLEPSDEFLKKAPSATRPAHYMLSLLRMTNNFEKAGGRLLASYEKSLAELSEEIAKQSEELVRLVHESAKKFKDRNMWSMFSKIASGILSTISILFGASLLERPQGGLLVGSLLVASGALALLNLVMEETKVYDALADHLAGDDRKVREILRMWIPAGVSFAATALGAAGSIGAFTMAAYQRTQMLLMMGSSASQAGRSLATLAEGKNRFDQMQIDAAQVNLRTSMEISHTDVSASLTFLGSDTKKIQRRTKTTQETLAAYVTALRRTRELQV